MKYEATRSEGDYRRKVLLARVMRYRREGFFFRRGVVLTSCINIYCLLGLNMLCDYVLIRQVLRCERLVLTFCGAYFLY